LFVVVLRGRWPFGRAQKSSDTKQVDELGTCVTAMQGDRLRTKVMGSRPSPGTLTMFIPSRPASLVLGRTGDSVNCWPERRSKTARPNAVKFSPDTAPTSCWECSEKAATAVNLHYR